MPDSWTIRFCEEFEAEFLALAASVRIEIAAVMEILEERGPVLGRRWVDTLDGSKHANMKEIRVDADGGVWRIAFAFDPDRDGILLVAGDKSGGSERAFYKRLIKKADKRFDDHLERRKKAKVEAKTKTDG
jgi:hypothetical protein